ncbi:MAG: hypothetical protein K6B68_09780 [Eubacterium sp.]|nr:hypothetical protein [Eubacterium sp.]
MKSKGTRDVSPELIKELGKNVSFSPFVEFARNNTELALCFRGNNSEIGKVVIYRHNHMIWELSMLNGMPKVSVSMDHARFMPNWIEYAVKGLMDLGFCNPDSNNCFDMIEKENGFAVRHRSSQNEYTYSAINLSFFPLTSKKPIIDVVKESYQILAKMQDVYFCTNEERFLELNTQSKKHRGERRPINYIKEYYFDTHSNASKDDDNHNFYSNFQRCREKHVQQDLFLQNHVLENGIFVYDLEFSQPSGRAEVKSKNQPDMFGIRFGENGQPESICMIEVKSTKNAVQKKESGLEEHLSGMIDYLDIKTKDGYLMDDRKEEARKILNHYHDLRLYGVKRAYSEEEFKKIKKEEIIFVFSDEVRDINAYLHRGIKIRDYLIGKGFKLSDAVCPGLTSGDITVYSRQFDAK